MLNTLCENVAGWKSERIFSLQQLEVAHHVRFDALALQERWPTAGQKEDPDEHEVLAGQETTDFRSAVGSLSNIVTDFADVQHEINSLAQYIASPTKGTVRRQKTCGQVRSWNE